MNSFLAISFALLTSFLLVSCSSTVKVKQGEHPAISNNLWQEGDQALDKAEEQYQQAFDQEISRFAPAHLAQAAELIDQAADASKQQNKLSIAERAEEKIKQGAQLKQQAEKLFKNLLQKQQALLKLRSDKILPKQYQKIDQQLLTLLSDFEQVHLLNHKKNLASRTQIAEKVSAPKERVISSKMQQLLIDTLLQIHLRPAISLYQKSQQEQAAKFAPQSCQKAAQQIQDSESYIRQNFQDQAKMISEGKKVQASAQHCLYVARETEHLINMNASEAEQKVLDFENFLHDLVQQVGEYDFRRMSMQDQVLAIRQAIIEAQQQEQHQQQKDNNQKLQQKEFRIQQLEYLLQQADIALPEQSER